MQRAQASRLASAARSPELSALLADLDTVRLLLATDLELAAAALDAGAPDLAAEAVAADREVLAAFEQRALHHLAEPTADAIAPAASRPLTRRRLRRLLPAAPALAAAALVAVLAGLVPTTDSPAGTHGGFVAQATTSYTELARLARGGAHVDAVRTAARDLHADVAQLLPPAAPNAPAAHEALVLLELETAVLTASQHRAALEPEIVESQRLSGLLREALTGAAPSSGGPVPGAADHVVDSVSGLVKPPAAPVPAPPGTAGPGTTTPAGSAPAAPASTQPRPGGSSSGTGPGAGQAGGAPNLPLLEDLLRPPSPASG